MRDIAVRVENLGKRYTIGGPQAQYQTMRETATQMALAPLRRLRQLGRPGPVEEAFWALKDVSFEVKQGDVVGIIGRNGAGKTTLLKILSRITNPTEGYAETRGRVGSLLEVGTGFHPELTGRENIYLNGAILGMKRGEIDRKFDEIVAFSEIEKFLDTPVKRYSSGMYVRLAFAVAAHLEPEILLVDEVLAVGDAAFQKKCLGKMGDVAIEGRTVLFVSHNMTAVQALCNRSVWLEGGRVHCDGNSTDLIRRYLSGAKPVGVHQPSGEYDLTERRNDYLADKLIAQSLRILDKEGMPKNTFLMGEEMHLVVDVQGMSDYREALIGVIFKSIDGQWITSINSGMTCSHVDEPRQKEEQAILRIPTIPLTPGFYWIDVSVAQQGIGRLDYIEHAASFTVAEADVYGSGYRTTRYFGLVYLMGDWEIRNKVGG